MQGKLSTRLLAPGIKAMNRLRFLTKISVLGIILLIPMAHCKMKLS